MCTPFVPTVLLWSADSTVPTMHRNVHQKPCKRRRTWIPLALQHLAQHKAGWAQQKWGWQLPFHLSLGVRDSARALSNAAITALCLSFPFSKAPRCAWLHANTHRPVRLEDAPEGTAVSGCCTPTEHPLVHPSRTRAAEPSRAQRHTLLHH